MAAFAPLIGKNPWGEKGPGSHSGSKGKKRSAENPGHPAHVGRSTANRASERGDVGEHRPSGQPRQTGAGRGSVREYVQRSRHALGQFRQERTLRADPLVQSVVMYFLEPAPVGEAGDLSNK